jgi:hypothetical protein
MNDKVIAYAKKKVNRESVANCLLLLFASYFTCISYIWFVFCSFIYLIFNLTWTVESEFCMWWRLFQKRVVYIKFDIYVLIIPETCMLFDIYVFIIQETRMILVICVFIFPETCMLFDIYVFIFPEIRMILDISFYYSGKTHDIRYLRFYYHIFKAIRNNGNTI